MNLFVHSFSKFALSIQAYLNEIALAIDLAYTTNELVPYDPLLLNRLSWILSGRL